MSPGTFLVAFRALSGLSEEQLIDNAFRRLEKAGADLIAVNDTERPGAGFEGETNELYLIDAARNVEHIPLMKKTEAGALLIDRVAHSIASNNGGNR